MVYCASRLTQGATSDAPVHASCCAADTGLASDGVAARKRLAVRRTVLVAGCIKSLSPKGLCSPPDPYFPGGIKRRDKPLGERDFMQPGRFHAARAGAGFGLHDLKFARV
jgi:hypothetical protein